MAVNKVIYDGNTLIDLTLDSVDTAHVLDGYVFHDASGAQLTGSCLFDADTSDATASAADILSGATAYAAGSLLTGNMTDNGAVSGQISTVAGSYTIPEGYHDGLGTVEIDPTEQAKIISGNIKAGIAILGVIGDYVGGGGETVQSKTVVSSFTTQTVTPDVGFDYLSGVTVDPMPYTYVLNAAGGYTAIIG